MEGGWGVFKSGFTAQETGKYKLEISAEQHGRRLETELLVSRPQLEKEGQPINAAILREIAGISHGASFTVDSLDDCVKQISLLPEPKPAEQRVRIWAEPLWGGLLLLLLTVYWVGRKLAGMI